VRLDCGDIGGWRGAKAEIEEDAKWFGGRGEENGWGRGGKIKGAGRVSDEKRKGWDGTPGGGEGGSDERRLGEGEATGGEGRDAYVGLIPRFRREEIHYS